MIWTAGSILMLAVLVGVTGYVVKNVLSSLYRIRNGEGSTGKVAELEERVRKLETATTSLLVDVTSMREKERFMAKLQAGSAPREAPPAPPRSESDISPMLTQSIPVIPRVRNS
jgi:hypothetical protein